MQNLDERVEKAINYLAETDEPAANAKMRYHDLDSQTKTIEALEFKKLPKAGMTIPDREAEVYTSEAYINHHKKVYDAMLDFEIYRNRRSTAEIIVEYWRSMSANKRQGA